MDEARSDNEKIQIFRAAIFGPAWREFCAELRAKRPILVLPAFIFLSRWADVIDVLARPVPFQVPYDIISDTVGRFMLGVDEDVENWRDKATMQALLRWTDLQRVRTMAGEIAGEALAEATQAGGGAVDVVATVSRLVPLRIVQNYFGFTGASDAEMLLWSRKTQAGIFHNLGNAETSAACVAAGLSMQAWLGDFLTRSEPWKQLQGDDVVSRLLRMEANGAHGLDRAAIVSNVCGLLIGSIETTSAAIVHSIREILSRPDQTQAARTSAEAGDIATFDAIVCEALRFNPIAPFVVRRASHPATLAPGSDHETKVESGRLIAAGFASAMFEASVFDEPETFRARPRSAYLHFGYGSHACVGRHVGHEMVAETVRQVLLIPGLRLQNGGSQVDRANGPFPEAFVLEFGAMSTHAF